MNPIKIVPRQKHLPERPLEPPKPTYNVVLCVSPQGYVLLVNEMTELKSNCERYEWEFGEHRFINPNPECQSFRSIRRVMKCLIGEEFPDFALVNEEK